MNGIKRLLCESLLRAPDSKAILNLGNVFLSCAYDKHEIFRSLTRCVYYPCTDQSALQKHLIISEGLIYRIPLVKELARQNCMLRNIALLQNLGQFSVSFVTRDPEIQSHQQLRAKQTTDLEIEGTYFNNLKVGS